MFTQKNKTETRTFMKKRAAKTAATIGAALFFTFGNPGQSLKCPLNENISFAEQASYNARTNPLEAGSGIRSLASGVGRSGSRQEQLDRLFSALRVGGNPGLRIRRAGTSVDTRAPGTAEQTLSNGGDCTEFAFVAISAMQQLGIPGGAKIVHFRGRPNNITHLVAFANVSGQEVILDPQAGSLGSFAAPIDRTINTITFSQAAGIYHREYGNYFSQAGRHGEAARAFERAITLYPEDAYSHHKLAISYERLGRNSDAAQHHRLALQYDPQNPVYQQNVQGADVTELLRQGQAAYNAGFDARAAGNQSEADQQFGQCIRIFEQVLSSGDANAQEQGFARQHLDECRRLCSGCSSSR
jgi:tetratricopeptide (TPR) repeat protein